MRKLALLLVLVDAAVCSLPALAEELTVAALKAFTAKIDAAVLRCDVDTVVDHISPLAVISGTKNEQGNMLMFRMNKTQYGQMLTIVCKAASDHKYVRTNEKISVNGDQATITAEVTESMTVEGRAIKTTVHERATIESIDGKLMLTQLIANEVN